MTTTRATCRNPYSLGLSSLLLVFLAACGSEQAPEPAAEQPTTVNVNPTPPSQEERVERERNKAVIASFMEVIGDSAAEQEFLAADHHLVRSEFHNLSYNAAGSELADISDEPHVAIPDRSEEIIELIGEGSTVVVHYKIRGTHQGNFYGIPATGKSIELDSIGIFELADGKIKDSWFFAEEAAFLIQTGTNIPRRADGKIIAAPSNVATRNGDDILAEALANPINSQEYRNKLKLNAYKAANAPDGLYPVKPWNGRPYNMYTRTGFVHFSGYAKEPAKTDFPFKKALPDRVDMIGTLIADGDKAVIRFLLTATNPEPMYGIPATKGPVGVWEVGIMTFNGDDWDLSWWLGDDLGMLTQLGGSPEWFAVSEKQ